MNPKKLRQLADSFAVVELRDCTRQNGETLAVWLSRFAIPVDDLPSPPEGAESYHSIERDGVFLLPFFNWWIDDETVIGRPIVPNQTESGLPRNPSVGYRIPLGELKYAPKVKRKQGERDRDGYVVIGS